MSDVGVAMKAMVEQAAGIVTASANKVPIKEAMRLVGFSEEERSKFSLYQKVRRRSLRLEVVEKGKTSTPPSAVDARENVSATSDLTNSTSQKRKASPGETKEDSDSDSSEDEATTPATPARRRLVVDEVSTATSVSEGSPKSPDKIPPAKGKRTRRSCRELQRENAAVILQKQRNSAAMKAATRLIKTNKELPKRERKTMGSIVSATNKKFGSNINTKTAGRYVLQGLVGTSPLKKGPVGDFPKRVYTALKGAFTTFLKLEQACCKKQSTTTKLSKRVNKTVNYGGFKKCRDDLTRKLKRDTAIHFDVGKANVQERRRVQWTTKYNLDVWFSTWKETLIELGFGRGKEAKDEVDGEVVFFAGQLRRILNMDETDGSIDDTTGQRGGRPPMTFHCPDVCGGATAVNKSGYSATIICGSNAEGEPLPAHFQLKSLAQTAERQRMSVDWFTHTKKVMGRFGHVSRRSLPCTFGMNEKAGMNAIELEKYMRNSIIPLYPDIADTPLKRVLLKIDSGPGRTNVEMLASLRLQGLYLVPGVPNTTGKTQETDQNYGPFKSSFRANIRELSQLRFDKKLTVTVTDLPLLVFGGTCPKTGIELIDSFGKAFSIESNVNCWKKCGAVPLTRNPVHSKGVRSEIAVGRAALEEDMSFDDPEIKELKRIEALNHFYTDILSANGFDGSELRLEAPTRETFVAVTKANTKERVQAIQKAKTAGQMFFATGGQHINSDEFFRASELRRRKEEIKAIEDKKANRKLLLQQQKDAVAIIRQKGELTSSTFKTFVLAEVNTLLKWKAVKADTTRKADVVKAYINAPKQKPTKIWSRGEEAALVKLKEEMMPLKDTALGVATNQMARAVTNNLSKLDDESIETLKTALQLFSPDDGTNVL